MQFNWHNKTVLVAEDDPINFRYLQLLLEKRTGISIIWAKDGVEAYEKMVNHFGIDIVLLDLQLPELNGLEVLKHARAYCSDIPVIMQTANSWNNEQEISLELGANAFFVKPLNIDALFECMDQCLREYAEKKRLKASQINLII